MVVKQRDTQNMGVKEEELKVVSPEEVNGGSKKEDKDKGKGGGSEGKGSYFKLFRCEGGLLSPPQHLSRWKARHHPHCYRHLLAIPS